MKLTLSLLLASIQLISAATYYVDFDGGSDASAGTSTGTAWKHHPGDANATGTAASTTLSAGDTVNLKGGVHYRGLIDIESNGSAGNLITHQGNAAVHGWGTGKAIIDGSEVWSPSWTVCTSASQVKTNANFASIYYATIPATFTNSVFQTILYNGTNVCPVSQEPNPTNIVMIDIMSSYYTATSAATNILKDTSRFTSGDSSFYDESYVFRWAAGNDTSMQRITSFYVSTNTIFTDGTTALAPTDYYSIFNNRSFMDSPMEVAVVTNESRIYIYSPDASPATKTFEIACRKIGFTCISKTYNRISGFAFRGMFGSLTDAGYVGISVGGSADVSNPNTGLIIDSTDTYDNRSMKRSWNHTAGTGTTTFTNNTVMRCYGGGWFGGGVEVLVANNVFSNLTGTAMYLNSATNSMLSNNIVHTVLGTHANGASMYGQGAVKMHGCVFANSVIRNSTTLLTMESDTGTRVIGSLFDASGQDCWVQNWGQPTKATAYFIGNTFINNPVSHNMLRYVVDDNTNYVIGNIIDGGGGRTDTAGNNLVMDYNVFTGLAGTYSQATNHLGVHYVYNTNLAEIFESITDGQWRLKAGSPALNAGTDLSPYGVTLDGLGIARGNPSDAGAYEYQPSTTYQGFSFGGGVRGGGSGFRIGQ